MAGLERRTRSKVRAAGRSARTERRSADVCSTPPTEAESPPTARRRTPTTDKRLVYSNWPEYIDEDDKNYVSTLTQSRRTPASRSSTPPTSTTTTSSSPRFEPAGILQPSKRDLFALTDWMAARMIQVGWIQKLDASKVPNLHANIIDSLKSPGWDKKRDYSAPWQSGLTGIAYNKSKVGEIKSFSELLTRKDLKGRVTMLTEMRDTMGFMLLVDGADPGELHRRGVEQGARPPRQGQQRRPVPAFTGNDYVQDLASGNVLAARHGPATSPMPATTTSCGSRQRRAS